MVLAEHIISIFLPVVANGDGGVVNKWLDPTISKNTLHPGVPTRSMICRFAALRGDLGLHEFPARAIALAIKSCTYIS